MLVHGAWHGGWCWTKVAPLLQEAGHTVVAPDLPGHGSDPTPTSEVTLQAYAGRICEVVRAQAEPVILAGHSMGGVVISQAAEQCPDRIGMLVYLTAYLLPNGHNLTADRDPESLLRKYLRPNERRDALTVDDEGIVPCFYHDCDATDAAFAKAHLVPQAWAPHDTPLKLSEANYGRLPRVYIECLRDRVITPEWQRRMRETVPCEKVLTLGTGHSPFFSAPRDLAACLLSLA